MGERRSRFVVLNGQNVKLSQLAIETGISYQVLRKRHERGLPYKQLVAPIHIPANERPRNTYI